MCMCILCTNGKQVFFFLYIGRKNGINYRLWVMKNFHNMCFAQDFSSNNRFRHNFNFKAWFFSGILKIQSRWEEEEKKKFWQTCLLTHFVINILLSSIQSNKTHVIQQKIDQETLNILSILRRLRKENESLPLEIISEFMCFLVSIRAHFQCLNGESFNSESSVQAETQIRGVIGETSFQEKRGKKTQIPLPYREWS